MMRKRSNSVSTIVGIAVLIGSLVSSVKPSVSKPGDVLTTLSSPGVGAPAQEKRDLGTGDLSYASRTGALQYNYKFLVPPGRLGVQPSVDISYSSQGSLRGGIASGWSMDIPMIELDTSDNRILGMSSEVGLAGVAALENVDLPFVSSMSGGHRLVPVEETVENGWQSYRAEYDDSYIRYERHQIKGIWRARTMDGKTWFFGTGHDGEDESLDSDSANSDPSLHDGIPGSLIFESNDTSVPKRSPHHQPLTRVVDAYGNTVRYFWQADFPDDLRLGTFPESLRLHSIRYTENSNANLGSHAKVEFLYGEEVYCSIKPAPGELPIGTSLNHAGFFPWYKGRKPLRHVETYARGSANSDFERVRRVRLDNPEPEDACPARGGAVRLLDAITLVDPEPQDPEDADQLQNPITFGYGPLERVFGNNTDLHISSSGLPTLNQSNALSWGYRRKYGVDATLERSLLDFDGDGRLDLIQSTPNDQCSLRWRRNRGNGSFDAPKTIDFPSEGLHWRDDAEEPAPGEGCSLSGRRTLWSNVGSGSGTGAGTPGNHLIHRFIDMNRDGRPDLVTAIQYTPCLILHNPSTSVPGISKVFKEPWPDNLSTTGACSDVTVNDVESSIENLCDDNPALHDCGCAVVDQDAVDMVVDKRRDPERCDLLIGRVPGFNTDNTTDDGETWAGESANCKSYPLVRNGHFPWTVHYSIDTESGIWFGGGRRVWSPIPLDPASVQSSIGNNGGRGLSSSSHAVMDITGDGVIDVLTVGTAVTPTTINGELGRHWNVFPGIADPDSGEITGFEDSPHYWIIPESALMGRSQYALNDTDPDNQTLLSSSTSMLLDTNADGLPDLIQPKPDESGFEVALNTGRGFCVTRIGEVPGTMLLAERSIERTGYDNVATMPGPITPCTAQSCPATDSTPIWGEGKSFAKLVDFDGDGLPDYYDAGEGNVELLPLDCSGDNCGYTELTMGAGAGFRELASRAAHHIPRDIQVGGADDSNIWWQKSDYMDLDGDGVDDIVTPKENSQNHWNLRSVDTAAGKPLRLLNSIDNGQGLVTKVEYHPYNDAKAMSQAATGKGMPSHIWVATRISSHSEIAPEYSPVPDSQVIIKYGDPAYTKNHRGQHGFRGFESIQTSRRHAVEATDGYSVSEQRYDYIVDWSGRLADTVTYVDGFPNGASELVAATSSKEWVEYGLFSGSSKSFHSTSGGTRNCLGPDGAFRSEAECNGSFSSGSQLTEMFLARDDNGGDVDLAWAPISTEQFLSVQGEEGAKRSESDVQLFSSPSKYFLHKSNNRSYVREGGSWALSARTTADLDPTDTYVQFSGQAGTIDGATVVWATETTRDAIGLVVATKAPNEFNNGASTVIQYAGLKVHPSSVTNVLGHPAKITTDHATGQTTRALGANTLSCDTNKLEGVDTYYDKLGRPVTVTRRSCVDGSYREETVSRTYYYEYDAQTGKPAHVTTFTVLDSAANSSSESTAYVDGAGRMLSTETVTGSDAADVASSVFHYDSAGQLVRHQETNPSTAVSSAEYAETVYEYDSLGRATQMRQGNNAGIGVDLNYSYSEGVSTKTSTEIVSDDGATGEKRTHSDHFGRLLQVDEKMDGGSYASTAYEYDGNDNVAKITDAADVVTELFHDMAGRRTRVVRGEREWSYAYDRNGNMVRQTSPNNLGESADAPGAGLYTSSTVYDALDRPTSQILAINGLSNKQRELYDADSVAYQYDLCTSGIGKVCSVQSGDTLNTDYIYDWAGRVTEERQTFEVSNAVVGFSSFNFSRSSHFAYNSSGAVTETWLADGPDQASSTHLQYEYNAFTGAPEKLAQLGIDSRGNPTKQEIAFVTRNQAQRVVSQTTGCLTRQWDYDYLGRVTDTEVQGVGCSAQNGPILSEDLEYFDSSEVKSNEVYRAGLVTRKFEYKYDSQHQLIEAKDSDSYQAVFHYSPDGNGTIQSVSGPDGILLGRDPMTYSYGDGTLSGADEHAPETLSGVAKDLHYSYDFAGNVSERTETLDPTGSPTQDEWSFTYDGVSQQREVQLNNGTGGRELYYYDIGGQRYMAVTYTVATDTIPERIRIWIGGAELWYRPNATSDAMEIDTEYAYLSLGAINIGRIKSQGPALTAEATFANGLSHVMGSVDWDTGVVNAAFVYGPYGEIVDSVGQEQDDHLRRFNGKESDLLSKLSYYGFRYYDKQSLSWTQADPLFLFAPDIGYDQPRLMSLYTFSLNNPVRYMDPDGRMPDAQPSKAAIDADIEHQKSREATRSSCKGDECGDWGDLLGAILSVPAEAVSDFFGGSELNGADRKTYSEQAKDVGINLAGGKLLKVVGSKITGSLTSKGDETVDLFRAVSKAEQSSINATGKFSMGPGNEMKQFGLTAAETVKFGTKMNGMSSGSGYNAVVKATVPKAVADVLDATNVDSFIFKSGARTATTTTLDYVNDNLIGPITSIFSL